MAFTDVDRLVFARLYHLAPGVLNALKIVKPETVIRWHRAGFRAYWRRRSGPRGGRPQTPLEIRWPTRSGARHGSMVSPLKLGIEIGQTTVAKYMAKEKRPPSQGWRTFISNHAEGIAALDLFVVPTLSFRLRFGLLILRHDRREILWLGVTAHPTAEWIAQQVTEAIGWEKPPKYLLRDRDRVYGDAFMSRIRAMGIRDRPTAARSPWQNGYCERAIGSIRRDCLDHVIVFGESHLLHLLRCYASYYNRSRTHLSLNKDAPTRRPVHTLGKHRSEARPRRPASSLRSYLIFDRDNCSRRSSAMSPVLQFGFPSAGGVRRIVLRLGCGKSHSANPSEELAFALLSACSQALCYRLLFQRQNLKKGAIRQNGNTRCSSAASIWSSPLSVRLNETRRALQARQMVDSETPAVLAASDKLNMGSLLVAWCATTTLPAMV